MLPQTPALSRGRAVTPLLGRAQERATGGCAKARRGAGGPPLWRGSLRAEGRWGDQSPERGTRGKAEEPKVGPAQTAAHLDGRSTPRHATGAARVPTGAASGAREKAVPRGSDTRDVTGGGPFGAGRACFRAEPEAPTVAASGTASGRANPDRKVRSRACPVLRARPGAAARHWNPGAARRRGPGLTPPAQPWSRPAGAAA